MQKYQVYFFNVKCDEDIHSFIVFLLSNIVFKVSGQEDKEEKNTQEKR